MIRPLAVLWLSVLVALFGGPAGGRAPYRAWSPESSVRQTPAGGAPETFVRAVAEWRVALEVRPRKDHPPVAHGGLLSASSATPSFTVQQHVAIRHQDPAGSPVPTSHRPILTTGPPSHA